MNLRSVTGAAILAGLLVAACGDDGASTSGKGTTTSGAGGGTPAPCAADAIEDCAIDQLACVVDDGPRCVACPTGQSVIDGACVLIPGQPLSHRFSQFTTQPGEEVRGLCQSWTIGNETELWVHAVELQQDVVSHHSNWTFVPEARFDGPDGVWRCEERGYDQLSAAIAGGVLYAQSTQAEREVQRFPEGAAIRIPPRARIIGDVHLLNAGQAPVTGSVALTIYAIEAAVVTAKLTPFHMTYDGLAIPPRSTSRFEGACTTEGLVDAAGDPLPMRLFYILPHTHAQGRRFFFSVEGGAGHGLSFDVEGFNGEARGRAYDPPVDLTGASVLRFGCEFDNPREEPIGWGFGDQEMCEMLGYMESPVAFESRVDTAEQVGEDGGMPVFSGPCETLVVPWDHKQ